MNIHDHTFASQALECLATLAGSAIFLKFANRDRQARGIAFADVLAHRHLRLMIGGAVELMGWGFGTAVYLPVWPMFSAGQDAMVTAYANLVAPLTIFFALLTVVGVIVMLWGWLERLFGRATLYAAIGLTAALYFGGAFLNSLIASVI